MAVIFAKTPKGYEEIEKRSGDLSPRVRRLLIFIDGKRSVEELHNLLAADDLTHTLGMLEEQGYIDVPALPVGKQLSSITAFTDLDKVNPENLEKARNFMSNTITAFAGTLGTSSLIYQIQASRSHAQLRAAFNDWYHTIVSSRDGRREAESLRAQLLEII